MKRVVDFGTIKEVVDKARQGHGYWVAYSDREYKIIESVTGEILAELEKAMKESQEEDSSDDRLQRVIRTIEVTYYEEAINYVTRVPDNLEATKYIEAIREFADILVDSLQDVDLN